MDYKCGAAALGRCARQIARGQQLAWHAKGCMQMRMALGELIHVSLHRGWPHLFDSWIGALPLQAAQGWVSTKSGRSSTVTALELYFKVGLALLRVFGCARMRLGVRVHACMRLCGMLLAPRMAWKPHHQRRISLHLLPTILKCSPLPASSPAQASKALSMALGERHADVAAVQVRGGVPQDATAQPVRQGGVRMHCPSSCLPFPDSPPLQALPLLPQACGATASSPPSPCPPSPSLTPAPPQLRIAELLEGQQKLEQALSMLRGVLVGVGQGWRALRLVCSRCLPASPATNQLQRHACVHASMHSFGHLGCE